MTYSKTQANYKEMVQWVSIIVQYAT